MSAAGLIDRLRARGAWVATAESCSGGLLAAAFTDIAGASDVFGYGVVTYSNQAKMQLLQVGKETLATNTYGQSKGRSGSYSTNWQQAGRELLQPDEIRKLDNRYAILLLRGEAPMLDEKYDLMSHPGIRLTPDCGAPVYDHTLAPRAKDDVILDPNRVDDYAILDADDILYSNYKNEGE